MLLAITKRRILIQLKRDYFTCKSIIYEIIFQSSNVHMYSYPHVYMYTPIQVDLYTCIHIAMYSRLYEYVYTKSHQQILRPDDGSKLQDNIN